MAERGIGTVYGGCGSVKGCESSHEERKMIRRTTKLTVSGHIGLVEGFRARDIEWAS